VARPWSPVHVTRRVAVVHSATGRSRRTRPASMDWADASHPVSSQQVPRRPGGRGRRSAPALRRTGSRERAPGARVGRSADRCPVRPDGRGRHGVRSARSVRRCARRPAGRAVTRRPFAVLDDGVSRPVGDAGQRRSRRGGSTDDRFARLSSARAHRTAPAVAVAVAARAPGPADIRPARRALAGRASGRGPGRRTRPARALRGHGGGRLRRTAGRAERGVGGARRHPQLLRAGDPAGEARRHGRRRAAGRGGRTAAAALPDPAVSALGGLESLSVPRRYLDPRSLVGAGPVRLVPPDGGSH